MIFYSLHEKYIESKIHAYLVGTVIWDKFFLIQCFSTHAIYWLTQIGFVKYYLFMFMFSCSCNCNAESAYQNHRYNRITINRYDYF